jgi:hypothetical protein
MKFLRLLLLLLILACPIYAQTGPGALRPPPTSTLLSAVTTDTNSSPLSVRDFGAVNLDVAISGGTVVVTVKARINTAATFRAIGGYSDADGSTVSTITASGSYTFTTAGKEDIEVFTTSTSGATTTVIARPIPSVGKAVRSSGGSTSLAVGTTAITGGTSGRVLKNNAGTVGEYPVAGSGANVPLIDGTLVVASGKTATVNDNITLASDGTGTRTLNVGAGGTLGSNAFTSTSYMPLAGGTFTGDVTHSGAAIIISGNISTAAWTTNGVRIKGTPGTLTDTTSSGTVATAYTDVLGGNTIAASSATTFTNYFTQYNKDPIAGTNVTLTNKWALGGDSLKVGTSNPLTVSNAGVLNATSPVFVTPTLGAATATTINGNTFTTGTYTLTGTAAKTLNFTNSITLAAGADGTTQTFPTTSATIARTDAGQTFTGSQTIAALVGPVTITEAVGSSALTLTGATQTASNPVINASQTWNNSGVTFTGIKANFTDTTSAAASLLLDLQVGSAGKFQISKAGTARAASGGGFALTQSGAAITGNRSLTLFDSGSGGSVYITGALGLSALNSDSGASADVFIRRVGAANPGLGAADAASPIAQTLSVQNVVAGTADTAGVATTIIGSLSTGSGASGDIILKTGGTGASSTVQNTATTALTIKGATQNIVVASATESTTTTSGALQVAGGAAIRKRVFIDGITTSSGLQTAVLCQSSGGEMIADSVACLASSGRFKQDVKPLMVGLDEVMRLRPVSYRYKQEGIFAHNANYLRERIGFIAEDVQQIEPRVVGYEADGKTARTVSYETMVPLLVKSIQELKGEVDTLKAEIQSLKQPRRIVFHLPSIIGL